MRPVTINPANIGAALTEIMRASHENDLAEIAQNFSIGNGPVGAQRTFNGGSVQLSAAGVGNSATSNFVTLFTYTRPAGALSIVGEGLTIFATGTLASDGNDKVFRLRFSDGAAHNTNYASPTVSSSGVTWWARATIFKTGTNTQLIFLEGAYGTVSLAPSLVTAAMIDGNNWSLIVQGQSPTSAASNDVVANIFTVNPIVSDVADTFATWISDCQKGGMNRTT